MRVWVCWILSIVLLLSIVADVVSPASAAQPAPASPLAFQPHAVVCYCRLCHSPRACCCKPVKTPLQAATLKARCDTPTPKLRAAAGPFLIRPAATLAAFLMLHQTSVYTHPDCLLRSCALPPLVGPPRLFPCA